MVCLWRVDKMHCNANRSHAQVLEDMHDLCVEYCGFGDIENAALEIMDQLEKPWPIKLS